MTAPTLKDLALAAQKPGQQPAFITGTYDGATWTDKVHATTWEGVELGYYAPYSSEQELQQPGIYGDANAVVAGQFGLLMKAAEKAEQDANNAKRPAPGSFGLHGSHTPAVKAQDPAMYALLVSVAADVKAIKAKVGV